MMVSKFGISYSFWCHFEVNHVKLWGSVTGGGKLSTPTAPTLEVKDKESSILGTMPWLFKYTLMNSMPFFCVCWLQEVPHFLTKKGVFKASPYRWWVSKLFVFFAPKLGKMIQFADIFEPRRVGSTVESPTVGCKRCLRGEIP